ncbi:exocyst complex component SEC5A isoform X2 [Amborella trichopoda]|uniref:exocyst complex component SEC5A isoform X2 n=1 Tax=Amborella trichopoda TaxID=13333 RepID=UPI0009BE6D15|nr:exocyst complex component SEC5A isoform X2 [Amborella trichopoda]|eukprot:XP_020517983.1 exocyst complex component SEC5A isoform X2 [Amborella trichopoda]
MLFKALILSISAYWFEKFMHHSEKFDAKLFLSRIHQNIGAADLEPGALALKTDLRGRTQQKKQLVKENFECFVSCKTTIDVSSLEIVEEIYRKWMTKIFFV